MSNLKSVGIHGTELAGYSSIVGQPIMLKNEAGSYIGQLALIGFQGDYKEAVAAIANALDAPNRHAYKVGFAGGRTDALHEALSHKWLCFHKCDVEIEVVNAEDIIALIKGATND